MQCVGLPVALLLSVTVRLVVLAAPLLMLNEVTVIGLGTGVTVGVGVGVLVGVGVGGNAPARTMSPNADVSSQLFVVPIQTSGYSRPARY